jgi:hypothetical protein
MGALALHPYYAWNNRVKKAEIAEDWLIPFFLERQSAIHFLI